MTGQKPTGVFVRLHDGALNEEQIAKLCNPKRTMTESLLAIGTPVARAELGVVGYEFDVQPQGCTHYTHDVGRKIGVSGFGIEYKNIIPLVRQSDALALLAARDAEIVRLWEENKALKELAKAGRDYLKYCSAAVKGGAA